MNITTVGIDLAKQVFQVHGVDERGKAVLKKQLKRDQVLPFFANFQCCLIGMEACGGAHFWANKLQAMGHMVKLMAPQFVKPYVKSNKNDAADAEAICEAVSRPNMRFVPIKTGESRPANSRPFWHCIEPAKASSRAEPLRPTRFVAYWLNTASPSRKALGTSVSDCLRFWRMERMACLAFFAT